MSHEDIDIIRAWKDEEYRNSLSEEQRSQLPENPAGMVELPDADMERIAGGVEIKNTENPVFGVCIRTVTAGCACIVGGGKTTIRIFGKCRI
jgi:mersacidin/lichenicidin family type 2 lantibiotic